MNVTVWLAALHMGAMHPYEKALTLFLAFAPFVLLAVLIAVRRRQDTRDDETPQQTGQRETGQRDK